MGRMRGLSWVLNGRRNSHPTHVHMYIEKSTYVYISIYIYNSFVPHLCGLGCFWAYYHAADEGLLEWASAPAWEGELKPTTWELSDMAAARGPDLGVYLRAIA